MAVGLVSSPGAFQSLVMNSAGIALLDARARNSLKNSLVIRSSCLRASNEAFFVGRLGLGWTCFLCPLSLHLFSSLILSSFLASGAESLSVTPSSASSSMAFAPFAIAGCYTHVKANRGRLKNLKRLDSVSSRSATLPMAKLRKAKGKVHAAVLKCASHG
eukprot:scaffold279685_cov35-Tisochrysis_lutea.AAC.3